jgi:flagellar protein FlaH
MSDDIYDLGRQDKDRVSHAFGGGFPKGALVLFEGPDGAGKSIISQRFTVGFCDSGYNVTYITPELTIREFLDQMASLNYPVERHLIKQRLLFLAANTDTDEQLDADDGDAQRALLSGFMDRSAPAYRSDIIIIDGFDALLTNDPKFTAVLESGHGPAAIENLLTFFNRLTDRGKTVILTIDDSALPAAVTRPMRNKVDSYFQLQIDMIGSALARKAQVKRYQTMPGPVDDNIDYRVQQGIGLIIESRNVT